MAHTRGVTRSSTFPMAQMRAAVQEARLTDAIEIFERDADVASEEVVLLCARAYLKKQQPRKAMTMLVPARTRQFGSSAKAEALMLLGVAESRVGDFDAADGHFAAAAELQPEQALLAELAYWRGRRYLEEQKLGQARAQLDAMYPLASIAMRARADGLESGILIQQERYHDAARVVMRMLEAIESSDVELDVWMWGMRTLASLARELDDTTLRTFVKRRALRDVWTADFAAHRFQVLKAAAWCHALEGDYFNTFRLLKIAGENPPSDAWRAMISLDRAYLARCLGERRWSLDELAEAEDRLGRVDWRNTEDEETVALLLAAELVAPLDAGRALNYSAQFSELPPALNPLLHFRYDRRYQALADYAAGIVQQELGNRQAAITKFTKAWNVYSDIRYDWRAGRCALRLYALTKDATWLSSARERLEHYSGSWLYDELQCFAEDTRERPRLTPAQQQVFNLLSEGRTTAEICSFTGRKAFTIQNHVKAILKAFNVPNRAALLAQAAREGLIGGERSASGTSTRATTPFAGIDRQKARGGKKVRRSKT